MIVSLKTLSLALACMMLMACGCRRHERLDEPVIARGPVPSYGVVAAAYNARVQHLERLSGSVALNIKARNAEGEQITEQVEGNLQIALPSSVALRVDKVGQTVFYLGSNPQRYWWFDLTQDPKTAAVGSHALATPEAVTSFGIPVHPLDLIEVLAIRPLPEEKDAGKDGASALAWSKNGRLLGVTLRGRWGQRRLWLDPETYEPVEIELLKDDGRVLVRCMLSGLRTIEVDNDANARPRVAQRFFIDLPLQDAQVVITLEAARNLGERMRMRVFDLETLLDYYKIQRVVNIDDRMKRDDGANPGAGAQGAAR